MFKTQPRTKTHKLFVTTHRNNAIRKILNEMPVSRTYKYQAVGVREQTKTSCSYILLHYFILFCF